MLTAGTKLGPYDIVAPLGAGGMGEVYRARDTRLNRDVALKILPDAFASDPDRLARFTREAQTLAALNHPHIAHIYGLDRQDGRDGQEGNATAFIVMELVEGEDLAQRIARGPVPLDEALPIAKQIAEALEAAHEQGIIHRDLKPANVKVRPDGTVKVLDFGLAKAMAPAGSAANVSQSPTLTTPAMTQAGMILGTAAYMSPEQARGKPADRRADIWAFGVVLFEMLAGRRPFDGEGISDTLAAVLKGEPAWPVLPSETSPAVHRLLRRCLHKDPKQRLQHMGDARLDIDEARRATPADAAARRIRASSLAWVVWAPALIVTALTGAIVWRSGDRSIRPEMRVELNVPGSARSASFAISPDGSRIAFTADGQRGPQLWVRSLNDPALRPLAGTDGGEYPFWSPDSRSIGFFAGNKLKRLDMEGGQPQSLATVLTPAGGTWNSDGTILYVPRDSGGVFRVSATGGESTEVTPRRSPELATRLPQFLPNGRDFLFYVAGGGEPPGIYLGELGKDSLRRILSADGPARYALGRLWFVRERTLLAQMFDPSTHVLSGAVTRVADNIAMGLFFPFVSPSDGGTIAYRVGSGQSHRQLVWFDRSGKRVGTAGEEGSLVVNPSLSPDGKRVLVQRTVQDNVDIWVLDLQRNVFDRLANNTATRSMPLWSPDGHRVLFSGPENGGSLAIVGVDRTSTAEKLQVPSGEGVKLPCDWSPDGRFVLYKQIDQTAGTMDLWALPMAGARTPIEVAHTAFDERDGQFSPDGKSVAYESDESGRTEIYRQSFPDRSHKTRISIDGGTQVRWRRDGRELFYIAPDGRLMVVVIDPAARASGIGTPVPLFKTQLAPIRSISRQQYVVSANGQRFLMSSTEQPPTAPITLILNWKGNPLP